MFSLKTQETLVEQVCSNNY